MFPYRPNILKLSIFFNMLFALILSGYCLFPRYASAPLVTTESHLATSTNDVKQTGNTENILSSAISRATLDTASGTVDVYLYPITEQKRISEMWCGGAEGKPVHEGLFGLLATRRDEGVVTPLGSFVIPTEHMFAEGTTHDGLRVVTMNGEDKFVAIALYGSCNGEYVELYEFTVNDFRAIDFISALGEHMKYVPSFLDNRGAYDIINSSFTTSAYDNGTGKHTSVSYSYDGQNFVETGARVVN